ncbi:hypothetical protein QQX98_004076 [Neonectria punicea]|uniref:Heterokaryon incompatibility domain-containing protein n=1 Tax=Neonectria punicea TaxID=979145 RepID=A0ABR1HCM3_9HYPO
MRNLSAVSATASLQHIFKACSKARAWGIGKLWAGSVCIDWSSSAGLSEAFNSMFEVFKSAQVSFAYLSDVNTQEEQLDGGWERPNHSRKESNDLGGELDDAVQESESPPNEPELDDAGKYIERSKWRRRVWVLQELVASRNMQFYDSQWQRVGSKKSLLPVLSSLFRIEIAVLEDSDCLPDISIACRMSWAAQFSTDQPEDMAYSLLGIFGVNMNIIYGEGQRAFLRLQEEILKDTTDASLFAWQSTGSQQYRGLFANSPYEFYHFLGHHHQSTHFRIQGHIQMTSAGILIDSTFAAHSTGTEATKNLRQPCSIVKNLRQYR